MLRTRAPVLGLLSCATLALVGLAATSAAARPKVVKSAATKISLSVSRAGDGSVVAKVLYTSPEPRCLEKKRFKRLRDGYYHMVGSVLYYEGTYGIGEPPDLGWLAPVTPFGKSPLVWEARWAANASVPVESHRPGITKESERHYESTVAAAQGAELIASARPSSGQGLHYWKVAYNKGGKHFIVKCRQVERKRRVTFG